MSLWTSSQGQKIDTRSTFKKYPVVYGDSLYIAETTRYHPEPGVFTHSYQLKKFNFKTKSWDNILPLFRHVAHPFEVHDHFLYATFKNKKMGFSNISNKQIGAVHDLVRINLISKQHDILYAGRINAYTVYKDRVYFSQNKKWKRSTTLKSINLNQNQFPVQPTPLIQLPLSVYEMCAIPDGIVGIGQLKTNQWVIFVWNPKHHYIETLFQSRSQISDLSTNDQEIVFSINKGDQIELQRINLIQRQRDIILTEPYLFSGVLYKDRLIALNQVENGNHIVMQNSVSKLIEKSIVATKIDQHLPDPSFKTASAQYDKYDLSENLKKAYPYYRSVFPLMLWGEDELRLLKYQVTYSNTGVLFLIDINDLLPLELQYEYQQGLHQLILSRQLYVSERKGVQGIKFGHNMAYSNTTRHASLNLDISTHYAFQNNSGELNIILPYYDTDSGLKRPYYNEILLTHRLNWKNGSILGQLNQLNQRHYALFGIRGFNNQQYMSNKEVALSVDMMHKLFSINKAISNPTMGIGSVFAGAYLEWLTQNEAQGAGVYLELELLWSTFNFLNTISFGYGYLFERYEHKDGSMFVEWQISL